MHCSSLSQIIRYTIALPFIVFAFTTLPSRGFAAAPPDIALMPVVAGSISPMYTVDVITNTSGESIAATEVSLTLSANLTYARDDIAHSSFPTEVTPVTVIGQTLHFARASFVKGGVSGVSVPVLRLTFSHSDNQAPSLQVNLAKSKLVRYSDSVDILHPSPTLVAHQNSLPTPLPVSSPLPLLVLVAGIGGLVMVGVLGYLYQLNKRST